MSKKEQRVYLINNGDFRESACVTCWPKQEDTLKAVKAAFKTLGRKCEIIPEYDGKRRHGFLSKQSLAAEAISAIDPQAPVVVVLSIWAFAHHVAGPLATHKGPILLLANFDGTWPGLVSLLNHSGSFDRMGIRHSRIWTEGFLDDPKFMQQLQTWCETGRIEHPTDHLADAANLKLSASAQRLADTVAGDILTHKRIMGQFDPGCMGMLNAVMGPDKLASIGMPIEYLSQSDLLAEMGLVTDLEAQKCLNWLVKRGVWFDWGTDQFEHLTHGQVLAQMKMYIAACRMVERYGLAAVGIPYQLGLARCCPSSDLVEGMLNNTERPKVKSLETGKTICPDSPIVHFNEGDIGAGVPQLLMKEIYTRKGMAAETTLHDVRWGREYDGRFIWVFLISGGAPPAHFGGWANTKVYRQAAMYFPLGGGTCTGVSKPGVITWARFYEAYGQVGIDCGTGEVVGLPEAEVTDRLERTCEVWPLASAHIPGYGRDELMATHMSNHIVVGYGDILQELVATCLRLGIPTRVAGDARNALS